MKRARRQEVCSGDNVEEREANKFAMALLMPRKWLQADIRKMGGIDIVGDEQVHELARRYQVSPTMMAFRIGQLANTTASAR